MKSAIADRERLLGRIRQIRKSTAAREQQEAAAAAEPADDPIRGLEQRVEHLEHLLEGLQDSVDRQFQRHDELIAKLQNDVDPAALGAALAKDVRNRGL